LKNQSFSSDADAMLHRLLRLKVIAVVGISVDPARASHRVACYLQSVGKMIIPVNPNLESWKGLACYPALSAVSDPVELVNVFRRSEFCSDLVREAVTIGVKGIWLQSGIESTEAQQVAESAGIDFVQNMCLMVEHARRPL